MDLFNQMEMILNPDETKKLLQQIQTNSHFSTQLKDALLTSDLVKVEALLKNEGIHLA